MASRQDRSCTEKMRRGVEDVRAPPHVCFNSISSDPTRGNPYSLWFFPIELLRRTP